MKLDIGAQKYLNTLSDLHPFRDIGKVSSVRGTVVRGYVPGASVGSTVEIFSLNGNRSFGAEVVGFENKEVIMMTYSEIYGVGLGSRIVLMKNKATVLVGNEMLGRVLDGLGRPLDDKGEVYCYEDRPLYSGGVNPMSRPPIDNVLSLGVRSIDCLLTVGQGQRVGIMAGSGVGKSVLLSMMAKNTEAEVNVIALIGERGREVREFIESSLGEEGMARSVVVTVTSDQSPLLRMRGAFLATSIAEHFASQGKKVLLMMDSVTRFAMAQREIGLGAGEPPATKGYTPSVFALLPKLLERAGNFQNGGSITGLYTVLVEGDDEDDVIGDTVRSIVDGHIVLSRRLTQRGHYPAVDVLQSASRVMRNIVSKEHIQVAQILRENLALYDDIEDLINIGAYREGANPKIDQAVRLNDPINGFLKQDVDDISTFEQSLEYMGSLISGSM